jgi:hypothetical protein
MQQQQQQNIKVYIKFDSNTLNQLQYFFIVLRVSVS